jgi:hypothetical protein
MFGGQSFACDMRRLRSVKNASLSLERQGGKVGKYTLSDSAHLPLEWRKQWDMG